MKEKSKSKSNFQLVLANFRFRAEWKKVTSRAEPSWKSFSSSYGSSQLGSGSSLVVMCGSSWPAGHVIETWTVWCDDGFHFMYQASQGCRSVGAMAPPDFDRSVDYDHHITTCLYSFTYNRNSWPIHVFVLCAITISQHSYKTNAAWH